MRSATGIVLGLVGAALIALGAVYLVVACQNLPGFLGPTPGESSPRTPLGAAILSLGLLTLGVLAVLRRRRRAD